MWVKTWWNRLIGSDTKRFKSPPVKGSDQRVSRTRTFVVAAIWSVLVELLLPPCHGRDSNTGSSKDPDPMKIRILAVARIRTSDMKNIWSIFVLIRWVRLYDPWTLAWPLKWPLSVMWKARYLNSTTSKCKYVNTTRLSPLQTAASRHSHGHARDLNACVPKAFKQASKTFKLQRAFKFLNRRPSYLNVWGALEFKHLSRTALLQKMWSLNRRPGGKPLQ